MSEQSLSQDIRDESAYAQKYNRGGLASLGFALLDDWADCAVRLEAEVAFLKKETAAQALLAEMERISEDYYAAGWHILLEFYLWTMVQGGDARGGFGALLPEEIDKLRCLSEQCGGWWIWDEEEQGERFLGLDEWKAMYEAREDKEERDGQ